MIFARLTVASQSTREAAPPFARQAEPSPVDTSSRLNGRLSVLDDSIKRQAFDTVQLRFRGVITSSVGSNTALEDIITLTDIKTLSDFRQNSAPAQDDSRKGRHVDFYFELPANASTADGILRPLPLSSSFSGTTSLTQNTALNDRRVIQGECGVSYWVEAQFRLGGKQVGFLNRHVQIYSLYPRLRVSLSKGVPLTIHAKPDLLARCRFQKNPDLSVTLYEPDMTIDRNPETGKRHITIPLAVSMDIPSPVPGTNSSAIDARQSFKCSVEAKWGVHSRFSTVPARTNNDRLKPSETISKATTASTQKSSILFRPLPVYESRDIPTPTSTRQNPYVATSQLDLSVPDAVSQPSLSWEYLSRNYTLRLSLNFHGIQGAPKYNVQSKIPLSVVAYRSKADDAQKDEVIVDVAEADSEDENVDDLIAPVPVSGDHAQRTAAQLHRQRAATRTPPPPYFR